MKTYVQRTRNKNDEWETPSKLFEDLDREFGFDLDACATDENHKCDKYYTIEDNGLTKNWGGYCVWCNPPYSRIKPWMKKCYEEGHKPNTTVVALVPARTDTQWFQNYVLHRSEVRFIEGRLRFGNSDMNAPFPSIVVIYRGPRE